MKCLNWKAAAGPAAAALTLYLLVRAQPVPLPTLAMFALCPLSMLLVVRAMGSGAGRGTTPRDERSVQHGGGTVDGAARR